MEFEGVYSSYEAGNIDVQGIPRTVKPKEMILREDELELSDESGDGSSSSDSDDGDDIAKAERKRKKKLRAIKAQWKSQRFRLDGFIPKCSLPGDYQDKNKHIRGIALEFEECFGPDRQSSHGR
jgi:hypothetical protein